MTQLTFDFSGSAATCTIVAPTPTRSNRQQATPLTASRQQDSDRRSAARQEAHSQRSSEPRCLHGSLPLHDPNRGEIHHLGDLAQLVVARYDIVRRRREARLAREAARRRELVAG